LRFLVDADLPRSTGDLVRTHGHEAVDVRDVGLRSAKDVEIASYARERGYCLLTGDFHFSDIRAYPPNEYSGLVVLKLPRNASARYILQLLDSFLQQRHLVAELRGKLAIVQPGRARMRPK